MRIAIPVWEGRISPVFDTADQLLLVDEQDGCEKERRLVSLTGVAGPSRADRLRQMGVQVLLCGGITRPLWLGLTSGGITVIPNLFGEAGTIVSRYLAGEDLEDRFTLHGRRRGRRPGAAGGPGTTGRHGWGRRTSN